MATIAIAIAGTVWLPFAKAAGGGDGLAMAAKLGHFNASFSGNTLSDRTFKVQTMTSESHFPFDEVTQAFDDEEGFPLAYGDYLNNEFAFRKLGYADQPDVPRSSRANVEGGGGAGCGRLAPCPANQVVEPGSVCLALLGLAGLIAFRRSRFHPDNHSTRS